ncbi:hypothetical protein TNCV_2153951 [Trichonephila clavipes]|nr:hypothetical protein TNCV_2153951 [Trichonephila clavipes]
MKKRTLIGYVNPNHLYAKFTPSDHAFNYLLNYRRTTITILICRAVCSPIRGAGGGKREYTARAESIPKIFNGIKVKRIRWPRQTSNPFTIQVVIDDVSSMGMCVSSIKNKSRAKICSVQFTMGSGISSRY